MDPKSEPQPVKTTVHETQHHEHIDRPPLVAKGEKKNVSKIIILAAVLGLLAVCAVGGGYLALYTNIS